jgi:hypothetical protein
MIEMKSPDGKYRQELDAEVGGLIFGRRTITSIRSIDFYFGITSDAVVGDFARTFAEILGDEIVEEIVEGSSNKPVLAPRGSLSGSSDDPGK